MTGKLRFAVMVPGDHLKAWQIRTLEALIDSGHAEAVLVIRDARQDTGPGRMAKYTGPNGLYHLYERLGRTVPSMVNERWGPLLQEVPVLEARPRRKGRYSDYFDEDDISGIRSYGADFILRFGFNILRGGILGAARYGVWSYHHADEEVFRGGPAAFWEVYHRHDRIGVILQVLTEDIDGGAVLMKGWYPVTAHSWRETLDRVMSGPVAWPARVCSDIRAGVLRPGDIAPSGVRAPMNRLPRNARMLSMLFRLFRARTSFYLWKYLKVEQWNIALAEAEVPGGNFDEPRYLLPFSSRGFDADPCFWVAPSGREWLLYEHFEHRKGRGEIWASELMPGGKAGPGKEVLSRDFHLAYPHIFAWDGEPWMLAETSGSGHQWAYRLGEGETGPEVTGERILIEGLPAVDGTLYQYRGHWYFFCTLRATGTNTCLHIHHAPDLAGPWVAHRQNPVKTDISSARPAGPLFERDGILYRPAQDSAGGYGRQVRVFAIDALSPDEFKEHEVHRIQPGRDWKLNHGLHTLAPAGRYWLIDAKRERLRPGPWK